ncbi:MAG: ABC transporter permease [Phycisphaeraceae bacterium]|nr:ABC transporter permease [Phycisphaeraceae bacterium]
MNLRVLAIARNTFIESLRQPVLLMLMLGNGVLTILITWMSAFSLADIESAEVQGDNKVLLDVGLSTVFGCGALIAGFIATAAISREIENKTILTVVSKPISRWIVVFGKFLGVSGAILIATVIMLVFLLMAVRHGVMSTAADTIDKPVVFFALGAVFISAIAGAWGNFFYRWNFPQAMTLLLLPLILLAYVAMLFTHRDWKFQGVLVDLKPQILMACACLAMAVLVLTSVAIAASTRLGQVMTIVVCMGVFVLSLMSNYLVGREVFDNQIVAEIEKATPTDPGKPLLQLPGESFDIELKNAPKPTIKVGDSFFYSPSPTGFPMMTASFPRFTGNFEKGETFLGADVPPGLVVSKAEGQKLTIRMVGGKPLERIGPPKQDDFVFLRPTSIRPVWLVVWGAFPNMQSFWMVDAVSQNRPIPATYLLLAAGYAFSQITIFLALAILLFEGRDVG